MSESASANQPSANIAAAELPPTPIKDEATSSAPVNATKPDATLNGKGAVEDYEDDEEYEVEYVYEDEEEEADPREYGDEEAIEVDEGDEPVPGQHLVHFADEDEEIEVYEVEDDDELEEEEYDRISSKIDELLQKANSLSSASTASVTEKAAEPESNKVPDQEAAVPVETIKEAEASVAAPPSPTQVTEAVLEPPIQAAAPVEQLNQANVEPDQTRKPSPPVERSVTLEDTSNMSPPGMLRHMPNQWNISDLNDEESLSVAKDLADSDTEAEVEQASQPAPIVPTLLTTNLDAIREEEGEADRSKSVSPIPPEMLDRPRPMDRPPRTLREAMEDEEEINEIEIALEEWQEEEEEDDNDEVDELMPDNLLLHANDQIEAIDLPLTPSPTPSSSPASPGFRRPVSPSSLVLPKMRTLVLAGALEPFQQLLDATPHFFIDSILKAGWTALMYASYRGYPEIMDFCLKRGADCNYHKEFFTSLMAVCSSANTNEGQLLLCMDLLLEQGARVNGAIDKFGCSPLHYAARFGRALLTKSLCEHGAHLDHANRNGWTALHWAAAENHGQVVATLLDQGANVHLQTRDGVTASQLAALRNNYEIADALQHVEQSELPSEPQVQQHSTPEPDAVEETVQEASTAPETSSPPSPPPPVAVPDSPKVVMTERKFSDAEIEARKEEAREIVTKAIDAALSRDLARLGVGPKIAPPATEDVNELRKRAMAQDSFDEEEETGPVASVPRTGLLAQADQDSPSSNNFVMSLIMAAILFILLKIVFYFKS